jgi:hypothetical protein
MATEAERGETFDWEHDLDADVLILVARYWLDLGAITSDQRRAMGVPPAPPDDDVMTGAVVHGMIEALELAGPHALPLLDRLR